MTFLKSNLKFIIFLLAFGLVGGYFTGLYSIEIATPEALEEITAQVGSVDAVILITVVQSALYSVGLGLIGKIFSQKTGLWRELKLEKGALISCGLVSLIGGAILILADVLVFGNFSDVISESYAIKPTISYIIASITYGGVVEEVMLRLFLMSFIAFLVWKISRAEQAGDSHIIIANIIAAILFAAGHIPATVVSIGLSPIMIARCLLMNGGFGLALGWIYRKYGIHYSMLAHAGIHIVSKLIWLAFI